jgi:D-alanyl-lipoteichoic acid acyltransferase DltB (MBOAT superfamily)
MNFNSWQFLVFLPIVAAGYFIITTKIHAARSNTVSQAFLLAASLFFYACWNPAYLVLILFSVAVTWVSGLLMDNTPREGRAITALFRASAGRERPKAVLASSLILNLAVLFLFKYYNFFAESLSFIIAKTGGGGGTVI